MGRHKILKDAKNVSVRLERSFLAQRPTNYEKDGTWIRDLLDDKEMPISGLNIGQKEALTTFYNLFNELFADGLIDEYITDDIIIQAEIWGGVINE